MLPSFQAKNELSMKIWIYVENGIKTEILSLATMSLHHRTAEILKGNSSLLVANLYLKAMGA